MVGGGEDRGASPRHALIANVLPEPSDPSAAGSETRYLGTPPLRPGFHGSDTCVRRSTSARIAADPHAAVSTGLPDPSSMSPSLEAYKLLAVSRTVATMFDAAVSTLGRSTP